MIHRQRLATSIFFSLALWLWTATMATADMLISPTRVLMNNDNTSATMVLRNPSDGPRTYRLSWEDKRASEDGGYKPISENEEWSSAKDMVRFSPRQITVGPGENQTVRFNWRPPAELPAGEYRSHLLLQVIPDVSEPNATFESSGPQEGVGVQVFMQMSFSIPVVVRHDTDTPMVSIKTVKAVPAKGGERVGLELTLNREGNASSYGKVSVEMQRDANSPVEQIGHYGELSIYHEVDQRTLTIPLRDARIPEGALVRVAYEGLNEYEGVLWAEQVFQTK
ncbi:fimbrial biogenesis chaperone [Granulosicoccus sp. 3-233]